MSTLVDAVFATNNTEAQGRVGVFSDPETNPAAMRVIWHQTPRVHSGVELLKTITDHGLSSGVIVQHVIDEAYSSSPTQAFVALRAILTSQATCPGNDEDQQSARGSFLGQLELASTREASAKYD